METALQYFYAFDESQILVCKIFENQIIILEQKCEYGCKSFSSKSTNSKPLQCPQTDILITYQLTSNSIESLKSVDESEYWKRKLIELLLTRSIHIFPNDENSTQIVYDQISNNRISVLDKRPPW